MVVANHLSTLDILALSACRPAVFVTSQEIRESMLGYLVAAGGCEFVDRRTTRHLKREIRHLAHLLRQGYTVVVFPEATTSDGSSVLPFKRALVEAAVLAGQDVHPTCLIYQDHDGHVASRNLGNQLFYCNQISFRAHLNNLLRSSGGKIRIVPLPPVPYRRGIDSQSVTAQARQRIVSTFEPVAVA
jgi:1-acyl-sn-glycerol-3-phosphate acyltransferase